MISTVNYMTRNLFFSFIIYLCICFI